MPNKGAEIAKAKAKALDEEIDAFREIGFSDREIAYALKMTLKQLYDRERNRGRR